MFYKRPLVYAMFSLMVTTAPTAVLAEAAGSNSECRFAHRFDRLEVPVWVQERRAERESMRQRLFSGPMGRGHTARMTRPAMPAFEAPQIPDWVAERRAQMPTMPQMPDWVNERRTQMPTMHQMPAFETPQMPDWVNERRAQMPDWVNERRAQMPTFARPEVPDWVKEHRAQMPMSNWQTLPQVAPARPYSGAPVFGAPGWGGYGNGYGYNHPAPWGWHAPVAPVALASVDVTPIEVVEEVVEVEVAMPEPVEVEVEVAMPEPVAASAPAPEAPVATDSDADGVLNSRDMCPDSSAGATVDALGCEQHVAIVLRGVNFKTNSDELTDDSAEILDRVAATLVANPDIAVEVSGHTDSDGDAVYNKDLSQRRAETVMAYLVINGVPADNLSAMGYGEENPMAGNDSPEGKAQNRRVELSRK
ncbi:MAG: OmpA family protein [gamma proteobacterium endosymbiont of Lamellibrachia anaximandri]|nr:OmpA family protein [gamma proteobacterium endosymbiont of Lamellibrachia anaximandri]MBL3534341.1 OmpA family protein [gamma proteobacterium endosymbiont of Lamellibrachia anaximandri]